MKRISEEPHVDMTETTEQIVDFLVLVVFIGAIFLAGLIL